MNISAGSTYWALFKIFIPTSLILVLDSSKKRFLYSLANRILIFIPITKITQHSITSALHHSSEDYKTTSVIKVQENTHIRHLEYLPILHHQVQSRDTNIQPCNYGRTLTIHIRHNSRFINSFKTWSQPSMVKHSQVQPIPKTRSLLLKLQACSSLWPSVSELYLLSKNYGSKTCSQRDQCGKGFQNNILFTMSNIHQ